MQPETLELIETKYYFIDPFHYLVKGAQIIQFSHDYWLELYAGNEVYGHISRKLKASKPLPQSEGDRVRRILTQRINSY